MRLSRAVAVAVLTLLLASTQASASTVPGWYFRDLSLATSVELTAVTAPSTAELWLVGNALGGVEPPSSAFVARFDGAIHPVPSAPASLGAEVRLHDVAATPDDIWAVGSVRTASGIAPRIERYRRKPAGTRGEAKPFSSAASQPAELRSVAMTSSTDGWAVGYSGTGTLIAHWDGLAWTEVPSPSPGKLNSVTARKANDVWAVGHTHASGTIQTLVLHWDGVIWTTIPSPSMENTTLLGVAIAAENDVWAVGYTGEPTGPTRAIAMRWNGSAWQVLPPRPDTPTRFTDVSAASSTDVWFAAYRLSGNIETVHIEHWDGLTLRPSPIFPPDNGTQHVASALNGITAAPAGGKPAAVGWVTTSADARVRLPALLTYS